MSSRTQGEILKIPRLRSELHIYEWGYKLSNHFTYKPEVDKTPKWVCIL